MRIDVIQVPYHMGQADIGPAKGPDAYIEGGMEWALAEAGYTSRIRRVSRSQPYTGDIASSMDVNTQLADVVRRSINEGRFPLVLAGDCNSSIGTLAAICEPDLGVIWFDTHGDYNTPETTISGWFEGMPLAIATGQCYPKLWRQAGGGPAVRQANAMLVGVRDLDPAERDLLERSEVQVVHASRLADGLEAALLGPLSLLQSRTRDVYLHVDLDVLDPSEAPGVDIPTEGGLTLAQMEQAITLIGGRFQIKAAALTVFNPERDLENRTLIAGLRLICAIADAAARRRTAAGPLHALGQDD